MYDEVAMYLDLIAAKAKQLAEDCRRGRLWDGELERGLGEIQSAIQRAAGASSSSRC